MRCQGEAAVQSQQPRKAITRIDLSHVQLASSETARRINHEILLDLIRANQPISRANLARCSGLQRSTVSQIIDQLLGERWVCYAAQGPAQRGRPATPLRLNEDLRALAVDVQPGLATVAMVDLNGRLLARSQLPAPSRPSACAHLITASLLRLRTTLPEDSLVGIGISIAGRIDPGTQRLMFAPNLPWSEFDLRAVIEKELNLPVCIENSATACLLAELTFGQLAGIRDAVLVTVSDIVETAVFAHGQFISGHQGMAGEFGHIPLDPAGPRCTCGQKGCWETFASCNAALRYYQKHEPGEPAMTFQELLRRAEEGDHRATQTLTKQACFIGRGLRMIIVGLSPGVILVAGNVTSAWHRFGPVIEREVAALTLAGTPPRILPCYEGEIARLRGAAALVFQHRFQPCRQAALSAAGKAIAAAAQKQQLLSGR
jgi:transcriptional regulator of PTS gene